MRLSWNLIVMLAAVALCGVGCGGIHASQSVSPATFLMPGILKAEPTCPTNSPVTPANNTIIIATAR